VYSKQYGTPSKPIQKQKPKHNTTIESISSITNETVVRANPSTAQQKNPDRNAIMTQSSNQKTNPFSTISKRQSKTPKADMRNDNLTSRQYVTTAAESGTRQEKSVGSATDRATEKFQSNLAKVLENDAH
jgi:hypothetical protein